MSATKEETGWRRNATRGRAILRNGDRSTVREGWLITERIDPATDIGAVQLTVRDLEGSVRFYRDRIGFKVHDQVGPVTSLGVDGVPVVVFHGNPKAPLPGRATGLYHVAILVPSRPALAAVLRHLLRSKTQLAGASDHGVSEALYLSDPEGNGIEIYRDRPRSEWQRQGDGIAMSTEALDVAGLLAEPDEGTVAGVPPGTKIGHVHLCVADLEAALTFYRDVLGFDLTARYGAAAAFVSAGGYHHHIGFNTWQTLGAPAPPTGAAGLSHFEIRLPDDAARAKVIERVRSSGGAVEQTPEGSLVRDPSWNAILLSAPQGHASFKTR